MPGLYSLKNVFNFPASVPTIPEFLCQYYNNVLPLLQTFLLQRPFVDITKYANLYNVSVFYDILIQATETEAKAFPKLHIL